MNCRLRHGLARLLAVHDFIVAVRNRDFGRAVIEASRIRMGRE